MAGKDYSNWSKTELVREIKKLGKRKKYGIVWEDKSEDVAKRCNNELPVLNEDIKKEIKTNDKKPVNILIEGDNYHALSVLNYTHKGKVDVIYIDPPYNTGNEGFLYNDKIVDKNDSYRHSKWLSFMSKRLKLSKKLLKDSGVIFISIDDNEFAQLKILCNEIFEEKNFIVSLIWEKHKAPKNDNKYITENHEYILMYARDKDKFKINKIPRSEKNLNSFSNPDNDKRGKWISGPLLAPTFTQSTVYPIKKPNGQIVMPPNGKCWAFSKERIAELVKDGRIWFGKDGKNVPRIKRFLSELSKGIGPTSILSHDELAGTQKASNDLRRIFGGRKLFDYPKPIEILKRLFFLSTKKNSLILDFFAGSGTTGHGVLELNKEDDGKRKFILCTNNESNNGTGLKIATDICYPRIKKIIEGYMDGKSRKNVGYGGNFKYYKTEFVDAEPTDQNKRKIVDKSTEMLCLKEDCFDKVKKGTYFKIFKNPQNKNLGIIYDDEGIEPFKKEVKRLNKQFVVYVFSLDESAREEEFEDMKEMVELKPIPSVILNVYSRIFK